MAFCELVRPRFTPVFISLILTFTAAATSAQAPVQAPPGATAGQAEQPQPSSKRASPEDGWPDISGFLDTKFGFMPIAAPITEPAVGLGAAGAIAFINAPLVGSDRPNITVVGGLGTENGTKGGFFGDYRHWKEGRVQTLVGLVWSSINLDFYGIGEDAALAGNPLRYNMEPSGGMVEAKIRLGAMPLYAGLRYAYAKTYVTFDAPPETPRLPDYRGASRVGGLVPSFTFDTRDNLFTPLRGTYVEVTVGAFAPMFGGDDEFQRLQVVAMQYAPLWRAVFLGLREQAEATSAGTPFYLRPFVYLRGVPAMRYQGEDTAQVEAELRWQFWKRFSLVAFGGTGAAWTGLDRMEQTQSVSAGGGGIRYELARKYGIHVGVDLAWGKDGRAFYVQVGSAWARP